jgi:bridging integrator 3
VWNWLILDVAMTSSQTRIVETINVFYGESGSKDNKSTYYPQAVEDLEAETVKITGSPSTPMYPDPKFKERSLPDIRFCTYFPDINETIKKRSHKLLDCDALRAKVKRLVDKPSDDPTKLPKAEKQAAMARDICECHIWILCLRRLFRFS